MSSFENNISSTVVERIVRFNSEGVDDISSLLYIDRIAFLPDNENHSKEVSVWADFSPTLAGCIVYLFVVPFFCLIGIITNSINIWIFSRPRVRSLGCSAYFYFKGRKEPINWLKEINLICNIYLSLQQFPFLI